MWFLNQFSILSPQFQLFVNGSIVWPCTATHRIATTEHLMWPAARTKGFGTQSFGCGFVLIWDYCSYLMATCSVCAEEHSIRNICTSDDWQWVQRMNPASNKCANLSQCWWFVIIRQFNVPMPQIWHNYKKWNVCVWLLGFRWGRFVCPIGQLISMQPYSTMNRPNQQMTRGESLKRCKMKMSSVLTAGRRSFWHYNFVHFNWVYVENIPFINVKRTRLQNRSLSHPFSSPVFFFIFQVCDDNRPW